MAEEKLIRWIIKWVSKTGTIVLIVNLNLNRNHGETQAAKTRAQ